MTQTYRSAVEHHDTCTYSHQVSQPCLPKMLGAQPVGVTKHRSEWPRGHLKTVGMAVTIPPTHGMVSLGHLGEEMRGGKSLEPPALRYCDTYCTLGTFGPRIL